MIHVENGKVFYKGGKLSLMQDICCAIQMIVDENVADKEFLYHAVDVAYMSDKEVEEDTKRLEEKFKEHLAKLQELMEMDADELVNKFNDLGENSDDKGKTFEDIFKDIL